MNRSDAEIDTETDAETDTETDAGVGTSAAGDTADGTGEDPEGAGRRPRTGTTGDRRGADGRLATGGGAVGTAGGADPEPAGGAAGVVGGPGGGTGAGLPGSTGGRSSGPATTRHAAPSYASGTGGPPLLGDTVGGRLARVVGWFGDREALVDVAGGRRWTYAELAGAVDAVAHGLLGHGVLKGDRVALWAAGGPEWVLAQLAVARLGAVLVSVDPDSPVPEAADVLHRSGASLLIAGPEQSGRDEVPPAQSPVGGPRDDGAWAGPAAARSTPGRSAQGQSAPGRSASAPAADGRTGAPEPAAAAPGAVRRDPTRLARLRTACPRLHEVVTLGGPAWRSWLEPGAGSGAVLPSDREAELSSDDPAVIRYVTKGAGPPAGVVLSHHAVLNNAHLAGWLLGHSARDRICLPVPLHRTFGMVLGTLAAVAHGACLVLPGSTPFDPAADPAATLRAVERERCTALYGTPDTVAAELALPDLARYDLSSLRTGLIDGEPRPAELVRRAATGLHLPEVAVCHGRAETGPACAQTRRDDDLDRRTGTVGRVLPHTEIKVVDPATGRTVPRGTRGELCVRGHGVMLGYWDDPTATGRVVDAARWLHTGDLAVLADDGSLRVLGGVDEVIVRGAETVHPREVEEVLREHPGIADVRVVGVPDGSGGEQVAACVVAADGATGLTVDEVAGFCAGRLAGFQVPRLLRVVEHFPAATGTPAGRAALRVALAEDRVGLGSGT